MFRYSSCDISLVFLADCFWRTPFLSLIFTRKTLFHQLINMSLFDIFELLYLMETKLKECFPL